MDTPPLWPLREMFKYSANRKWIWLDHENGLHATPSQTELLKTAVIYLFFSSFNSFIFSLAVYSIPIDSSLKNCYGYSYVSYTSGFTVSFLAFTVHCLAFTVNMEDWACSMHTSFLSLTLEGKCCSVRINSIFHNNEWKLDENWRIQKEVICKFNYLTF